MGTVRFTISNRGMRAAEGAGFEPADPSRPPVFKTGALSQLCDPSDSWGRRDSNPLCVIVPDLQSGAHPPSEQPPHYSFFLWPERESNPHGPAARLDLNQLWLPFHHRAIIRASARIRTPNLRIRSAALYPIGRRTPEKISGFNMSKNPETH